MLKGEDSKVNPNHLHLNLSDSWDELRFIKEGPEEEGRNRNGKRLRMGGKGD